MTITIDDRKTKRKVEFFSKFALNLKYDSVASTFNFSFFYNKDNPEHKLIAQIGQYQLARVEHKGQLLITGFILSQSLDKASEEGLTNFSGYSVPGVLEDSNIPTSSYPLQCDGLSLRQIVTQFLKPFKIKFEVDASVGGLMDMVYEKITAEASQTVKEFFTDLATERGIIISHTANGRLNFTKARTDLKPILDFESGLIGTVIQLVFDGQAMHSPITVIKQADKNGGNAGEATIKNPYVPESTTAFRPKVIIQSSGDDNDTMKVAKNALAAELKSIKVIITTDRWEVDEKMILPNNMITVLAPDLYINKRTLFFIEEIDYDGDAESTTAKLTCVLPECYNGKTPVNIFI